MSDSVIVIFTSKIHLFPPPSFEIPKLYVGNDDDIVESAMQI
jgi:hypothetical protein